MKADIYIKVRFRTTEEGGRKTFLKLKAPMEVDFYACPMKIDDKFYDCRLFIGDREIKLGEHYEVPAIFLDQESVLENLSVGKNIVIWESREVADGQVIRICD